MVEQVPSGNKGNMFAVLAVGAAICIVGIVIAIIVISSSSSKKTSTPPQPVPGNAPPGSSCSCPGGIPESDTSKCPKGGILCTACNKGYTGSKSGCKPITCGSNKGTCPPGYACCHKIGSPYKCCKGKCGHVDRCDKDGDNGCLQTECPGGFT
jgi:hypothetical protein